MSYVQRVILLNKPMKVFGFEPKQLGLLTVWVISGLIFAGRFPGDWKFHNFPIGVWFFIIWMCAAVAVVMGTRLKPALWWRNIVLYKLGMAHTTYISHLEPAPNYPDGNIIDVVKTERQKFLVQQPLKREETVEEDDFEE